jgi:large subunit ribosomal protein L5
MTNRLKEKYSNEVVPALTEKFGYTSIMAVPRQKRCSWSCWL